MQSPNPAKPHGKNDVDANRRRKYLINPAFQWKHAITLSLAVFLLSSILSCVLYSVLHEQARHRIMYPMSYSMDVGTVILFSAFGFSVLTAGAVGFWCIFTTTVSGTLLPGSLLRGTGRRPHAPRYARSGRRMSSRSCLRRLPAP